MKISVIGLGKLGLPLAAVLADAGHDVIGVDVDSTRVESVNRGECLIHETGLAKLLGKTRKRLRATLDMFEAAANSEVTFVVVPTPSLPDGSFSMEHVNRAMDEIGRALRTKTGYHLVVLTSTVMPGSTEKVMRLLESASGKKCGEDFGLCYNPEFIALGSVIHDMLNPDLILIGESDPVAGDTLALLYPAPPSATRRLQFMNFVNAELAKLAINSYVTMKISFANTLARMCERLPGADVDNVTLAVGADSRIGGKYLKGAVGYGGPCFPRDNAAFRMAVPTVSNWLARAADQENRQQTTHLVEVTRKYAGDGAAIGVLGLAYKTGTDVTEESQAGYLMRELPAQGFQVIAYDPLVGHRGESISDWLSIARSAQEVVDSCSVIVIVQPCPEFLSITGHGQTLIDCWRMLPEEKQKEFNYVPLGVGPRAEKRVTIKP